MIWFSADFHLGHEKIAKLRGFEIVDAWNDAIIAATNWVVGPKDMLIMAGDFAWKNAERAGKWRQRLNVRTIHFIRGNHDRAQFDKLFSTAQDTKIVKIRPVEKCTQCSFGISDMDGAPPCTRCRGTGQEPRMKVFVSHYSHAYWPSSHHGSYHVYGHTHQMREETLDEIWPERRSMDVGVDNAKCLLGEWRPFSEMELFQILEPRKGHDPVEWYKKRRGEE